MLALLYIFYFLLLLVVICYDLLFMLCSDHAADGDAAFVESVIPPQGANVDETVKVTGELSAQQLIEELAAAAGRQAELVAQLKTQYVGESSSQVQKDEEIALLRAQLADA